MTSVANKNKTPWYAAGLHFECQKCGQCCSGPQQGFIWVTKQEIELIADFLNCSTNHLRKNYLKRLGFKTSIIEHHVTNDCIFLKNIQGKKKCSIYPVRPTQCRTWPFWKSNLKSPDSWNLVAKRCPGINKGPLHTLEKIQNIIENKKW